MALELAAGAEDVHEAQAFTRYVVVAQRILLGVSDEEAAADILDVKGSESAGSALVFESFFAEMHTVKVCVVDFDAAAAEVCDVKIALARDVAGSHALINRATVGTLIRVVYFQNSVR